jgi:NTP pyrophosphatase (non-canonical NTP hydrolase)
MNLNEYQRKAEETATWGTFSQGDGKGVGEPGGIPGVVYCALGLTGEAGEVADDLKKAYRNDGIITFERREKILEELGDVQWYLALLTTELGATLDDVAQRNLTKLAKRKRKNELKEHA